MKYATEGLARAGMDLVPPFTIELALDPDQSLTEQTVEDLQIQDVARVLPGRRLSGLAQFREQTVFAKVFYGKHARRYWQRDMTGVRSMHKAQLPAPEILHCGATADEQGLVVLYQALVDAGSASRSLADEPDQIHQAVLGLARLHDANLLQTDIHFGNFIRWQDQVWIVDGDGIRRGHLLRQQFANLAEFFAQRPPWYDDSIPEFWQAYAEARGEYVANMSSAHQVMQLTRKKRAQRVRRYLKKTQRSCTEFFARTSLNRFFVCQRERWPELQRFMVFPEEYLRQGTQLRRTETTQVVRCEIEGRRYLLKRYDINGVVARMLEAFARRARAAWRSGHWLAFLDIPAVRPVAFLEQRWGPLVGTSYLLLPDVGERDLTQLMATYPEQRDRFADQVLTLFRRLQAAGLQHGDLHGTHVVQAAADQQLLLAEYDDLQPGPIAPDVVRFQDSWRSDPAVQSFWGERFSEVGL